MDEREQNEHDGAMVAKVAHFQRAAQKWAEMDPRKLLAMMENQSTPRWMFYGDWQESEQVILIQARVQDAGTVLSMMLDGLPDPPLSQVMQAVLDWLQRLAVVRLEGLPPQDRQEALDKAEAAARATIASIRDLRLSGSRLQ